MVNGISDVYIDLEVTSLNDWEVYIPTSFDIRQLTNSGTLNFLTKLEMVDATSSGIDIPVYTRLVDSLDYTYGYSDLFTASTQGLSKTFSNNINLDVNFNTSTSGISHTLNKCYLGSKDYLDTEDMVTRFSLSEGLDSYPADILNFLKLYIGYIKTKNDTNIELFLSKDKYYYDIMDIYNALLNDGNSLKFELTTVSGRVHNYIDDLYSCYLNTSSYKYDIYNSYFSMLYTKYDFVTASGFIEYQIADCYSCNEFINAGVATDIRTWSLEIGEFFLEKGSFTTASSTMFVDITDGLYTVDIDNCYFIIDGVNVEPTFSGINNGYRMFYNPSNDFYSEDTLTIDVHAENTVGDIYERTYYIVYGYNIYYKNNGAWSYNKNILVRMQASNLSDCVNIGADSYYFITQDLPSTTLNSTINCVEGKNLTSVIYPQSTAFFYGKSYTVRVEGVVDFNGNKMEDFIFSFTIENPNN